MTHEDLREAGERCSRHWVRRLMKAEGLRAQIGYGSNACGIGVPMSMSVHPVLVALAPVVGVLAHELARLGQVGLGDVALARQRARHWGDGA